MRNKKFVFVITLLCLAVVAVSLAGCSLSGERQAGILTPQFTDDTSTGTLVAANNLPAALRVYCSLSGSTLTSSGFYISSDGYAVTNAHAVNYDTDANLTVEDYNGTRLRASVSYINAEIDIAVIKVAVYAEQSYVTFASSSDVNNVYPGDTAYVIGNPSNLGLGVSSATISALDCYVKEENNPAGGIDSIILDANINHGNSGGPLLNKNGYVVGVIYARLENNSASSGQTEDIYGLGCAVPSDLVTEFLAECNVSYGMNGSRSGPQ